MAQAYAECDYLPNPQADIPADISELQNDTSSSDDVITCLSTSGRPVQLSTSHIAASDDGTRPPSDYNGDVKTTTKTKQADSKCTDGVGTARTGDASNDFFLPGEVFEPIINSENVSEKLKQDKEASRTESRSPQVEDAQETCESISRRSGEITDDAKGMSPRALYRRSPDEKANRKGKGDIVISNTPKISSPRRCKQQNNHTTRFEISPKTGMMFAKNNDVGANAGIPETEREIEKSPVISCKSPNTSPSSHPEVINGTDEEALDLSRHHEESKSSTLTTTGDITCNLPEKEEKKKGAFPPQLSLEEYQQRGKLRKTTPKSAIKESFKIEQRFSRMMSAPQRSPPSRRASDLEESEEGSNPNHALSANSRPFSRHSQTPNGLDRKAQNTFKPIPGLSKHLEKEEERIKNNIWNNPLSPLPKIGVQPMTDQTATAEQVDGVKDFKDKAIITMITEPSSSEESTLIDHNKPIKSKPCIHVSLVKDSLSNNPGSFNSSAIPTPDKLESICGNDVVSSESATLVESETGTGEVEVDERPGGLFYVFTSAHEKQNITWVLPSCLQTRKDHLQEQAKEIRCHLESKNILIKTNREKLELSRRIKKGTFELRHEAVKQRRLGIINDRQLKTTVNIDCKQGRAKHNREVIRKHKEDRFLMVHERRNKVRERKITVMEMRQEESMEESGTELVSTEEENLDFLTEEVEIQDEWVEQQNNESEDGEMPDQEGEGSGKEDGKIIHDEKVMKDDDGSQHAEDEDGADGRMVEVDNINRSDTGNAIRGDGRINQGESAERRVEEDSNNESHTENHQCPRESSHELRNHLHEDSDVTGAKDGDVANGNGLDKGNVHREDDSKNQAKPEQRRVDEDQSNSENDTENHQTTREPSHEVSNHLPSDPVEVRGTEDQEVTSNGNRHNLEHVSREDHGSNQAESEQRRVDEDNNNSERHRENHRSSREPSHEVRNHRHEDPITGMEDFDEDDVQDTIDLAYRIHYDTYYELHQRTTRSRSLTQRRDRSVEAVSYYMEIFRSVLEHIEEISYSQNQFVFEEPYPARGDYYDEGDETTSDTDEEYYEEGEEDGEEEGEEEFVEEEPIEDRILRINEIDGSRRSRANRRVN